VSSRSDNWLHRPGSVNVAHLVERCCVLGPGRRFAIWVQGCPRRCPGCHNPGFQPFRDADWMTVDSLAARIVGRCDVEGITLVGGEPFVQAEALAGLSRRVREAGMTVMTYTGYTYESLLRGDVPHAKSLLQASDLLMDGPYRRDLPTGKPWRGSDNQRLIALSFRYAEWIEGWNEPTGQDFEIRVGADGSIEVLGIPPADLSHPTVGNGRNVPTAPATTEQPSGINRRGRR